MEPALIVTIQNEIVREGVSEAVRFAYHRLIQMAGTQHNSRWSRELPETRQRADKNTETLLHYLSQRVAKLPNDASVDAAIRNSSASPQVSSYFMNSLAIAAESDEDAIHQVLSRLIGERLLSEDSSTKATTIRRATEVLPYVNTTQLRLLGLLFLLHHAPWPSLIEPDGHLPTNAVNGFASWLTSVHDPVRMDTVSWTDLYHLESLNLLKVTDSIDRMSPPHVLAPLAAHQFALNEYGIFSEAYDYITNKDLNRAQLSTIGMLIGSVTLDDMSGIYADLRWLDASEPTDVKGNLVKS